jgi:hypothetical protein
MLTDISMHAVDDFGYSDTKIHNNTTRRLWKKLKCYYNGELSLHYDIYFKRIKDPPRIFKNKFISKTIEDSLCELRNKTYIVFSLDSDPSVSHKITIYSKDECLKKFVVMLFHCVTLMNQIKPITEPLEMYYYLTDFKKVWLRDTQGNPKKRLGIHDVNTGCSIKNQCFIWRKEDIIKTTLHELLHILDYDLNISESLHHYYTEKYKIEHIQNVNEGYIDFLAVLLNSFLISLLLKDPNAFELSIRCERGYIDHLAKQILWLDKQTIDQETNVFSYYIIKAEIMNNLNNIHDIFDSEHCTHVLLQNKTTLQPITPTQTSLRMNAIEVDLFKHKLS